MNVNVCFRLSVEIFVVEIFRSVFVQLPGLGIIDMISKERSSFVCHAPYQKQC